MLTLAEDSLDCSNLLYDLMNKHGIGIVEVEFDGEHDDGQIGQITADGAEEQVDEFLKEKVELGDRRGNIGSKIIDEFITDLCYDVLNYGFTGWQDNMGSQGLFFFSAKDRECKIVFGKKTIVNSEYKF